MIDSMNEEELFQPHRRKWADDATKTATPESGGNHSPGSLLSGQGLFCMQASEGVLLYYRFIVAYTLSKE